MLILTRKRGESIIVGNIGNEIIITVMEIDGGSVRIGVDAPPEIPVDREEVREQKNREKN